MACNKHVSPADQCGISTLLLYGTHSPGKSAYCTHTLEVKVVEMCSTSSSYCVLKYGLHTHVHVCVHVCVREEKLGNCEKPAATWDCHTHTHTHTVQHTYTNNIKHLGTHRRMYEVPEGEKKRRRRRRRRGTERKKEGGSVCTYVCSNSIQANTRICSLLSFILGAPRSFTTTSSTNNICTTFTSLIPRLAWEGPGYKARCHILYT